MTIPAKNLPPLSRRFVSEIHAKLNGIPVNDSMLTISFAYPLASSTLQVVKKTRGKTNTLLQKALMTYENPFSWGRNTCGFPHQGWTDHPTDHQKLEVRVHDQGILFRSVEDWSDLHYQVYPQRSFLAFCNAEKFVQSCSHIKQFACTHQPRAIPYCDIAGWNSWQWQAGNAWTCRWKWALSMRVGPRFITLQTGGIAGLLRLSSAEGPEKTRFNRAWTSSGCSESSSQWYCDACEAITCHWLDQQGLVDYHRNQRAKTESSVCLW